MEESENKILVLTPTIIGQENKAYQSVINLQSALNNAEIKNIALTGPYGSGKSSVLKTLKEKSIELNFLNISLATLEVNEKLNDSKPKKPKHESENCPLEKCKITEKETSQDINQLIEYSILQQIIYKEKQDTIPQSRFKRIKHISSEKSHNFALFFVGFVVSILIIINPEWLSSNQLFKMFTFDGFTIRFFGIIALANILYTIYRVVKYLTVTLYNNNLNKINIKDGEIEIAETTSIFNKHLDEILYFFEVTDYNVILFEDLDRFKNHDIFLKLRELNSLINESKAIQRKDNRPIVFIYAVRDDIFKDTARTKFFDYIVTIIPIINPSNSCEQLRLYLQRSNVSGISDSTCRELGPFIDDMRTLKNIINEFIQYRERLDSQLVAKKMLGIIVYKNYNPEDFSLLHNTDGIVYKALSQINKKKYIESAIEIIDSKIDKLKEEIILYKSFNSLNVRELRALYVLKYIEQNPRIELFLINGTPHTSTQIIDSEELFYKLVANEITEYQSYSTRNNQFISGNLNIVFSEIEKLVDVNNTFENRKNLLNKFELDRLNTEIETLQNEKIEIREQPIKNILVEYDDTEFLKIVGDNKLIIYLIQKGYIEEDYYDYISYFYPGTITPSDRVFLLDVMIRKKNEFDYKLNKIETLIAQIPLIAFRHESILNFSLIDHVIENENQYKTELRWLLDLIKSNKQFEFIQKYYESSNNNIKPQFYSALISNWDEFWIDLTINAKEQFNFDLFAEIFLRFRPEKGLRNDNEVFCDFIKDKYILVDIISTKYGGNNIYKTISLINVKFEQLVNLNESNKLLDFFIQGKYYLITDNNLRVILKHLSQKKSIDYNFDLASYSTIIEVKNEMLLEYINNQIEICLNEIFPITSINENDEAILKIINNKSILDETKIKYLSKQINKLQIINKITVKYWNIGINSNIVEPNWKNINDFFIQNQLNLSTDLLNFITNNVDIIKNHKLDGSISEEQKQRLFNELFGKNILQIEVYKSLIILFDQTFENFDLSQLQSDRIEYLIENKYIVFNEYNIDTIENAFDDILYCKLLMVYKNDFFEMLNDFDLNSNQINLLLKSNELNIIEKAKILKECFTIDKLGASIELANTLCQLLVQKMEHELDYEVLIKILELSSKKESKINFVNLIFTLFICDEIHITEILNILGGNYKDLTEKGPMPKFSITQDNSNLFQYLKSRNYISDYFEKKEYIKVTTKKK